MLDLRLLLGMFHLMLLQLLTIVSGLELLVGTRILRVVGDVARLLLLLLRRWLDRLVHNGCIILIVGRKSLDLKRINEVGRRRRLELASKLTKAKAEHIVLVLLTSVNIVASTHDWILLALRGWLLESELLSLLGRGESRVLSSGEAKDVVAAVRLWVQWSCLLQSKLLLLLTVLLLEGECLLAELVILDVHFMGWLLRLRCHTLGIALLGGVEGFRRVHIRHWDAVEHLHCLEIGVVHLLGRSLGDSVVFVVVRGLLLLRFIVLWAIAYRVVGFVGGAGRLSDRRRQNTLHLVHLLLPSTKLLSVLLMSSSSNTLRFVLVLGAADLLLLSGELLGLAHLDRLILLDLLGNRRLLLLRGSLVLLLLLSTRVVVVVGSSSEVAKLLLNVLLLLLEAALLLLFSGSLLHLLHLLLLLVVAFLLLELLPFGGGLLAVLYELLKLLLLLLRLDLVGLILSPATRLLLLLLLIATRHAREVSLHQLLLLLSRLLGGFLLLLLLLLALEVTLELLLLGRRLLVGLLGVGLARVGGGTSLHLVLLVGLLEL